MTYTTIITKLQDKGYRPVSHVRLPGADILRLEVYCSPILKSDKAFEIKEIVGTGFNVYDLNNVDAIFIEKEK